VTLPRLFCTLAAAACALLGVVPARAAFTGQDIRLLQADAARAPLAISGDGAWRLHVDAHDVLHRASLADPARETTLQLPHGVRLLSASGDGSKVALSTDRHCIGLVDFTDAAARLTWRPWVVGGDGVALGQERAGWVAQQPSTCGSGPFVEPVAISSDGRLVATSRWVVDAASNRVVASLPTNALHVLRLQFVDHDARLLIAGARLGDAPQEAGGLSVSVWDLAAGTLVNDVETDGSPPASAAALHIDYSPQTGALFHVEARRAGTPGEGTVSGTVSGTASGTVSGTPTPSPTSLELVQLSPGACGTAPRRRATLGDDVGAAFVVDPYGRWFAWSRPLAAPRDADELAAGARWALAVQDMTTGRTLERVTSRHALTGLVATPDGGTLFALASQPVELETGEAIAGTPAVPDDERLLELKLPDAATTAPRDAARAWERGFCRESGETPGARAMTRSEHLLKPLWSRDLGTAISAPGTARCGGDAGALFSTPDGSLWLDSSTQVAKVDPLTGTLAAGLPTPRSRSVCSVVTPAGTGFLNAGGDTLTWRPLAAATDATRRRIVDRHPGWSASFAAPRADVVRVLWVAGPRAAVERDADGVPQNLLVIDYDSMGRRIDELRTTEAAAADGLYDRDDAVLRAPCHDTRGTPLSIGYEWRAGPFGSQRGTTCGPLPGMARLVWWSGATIAPRLDDSAPTPRTLPAIDGPFAAVADDLQLHVINLALQREFAQVDLGDVTRGRAWVLAGRRLVLVEATGADGHRWLRAYAWP